MFKVTFLILIIVFLSEASRFLTESNDNKYFCDFDTSLCGTETYKESFSFQRLSYKTYIIKNADYTLTDVSSISK
jgi:hypothetical protein